MPDDDQLDVSPDERDPVADAVAAVDATLAQTPQAVRDTPEYKALAKQLRQTARELGRSQAAENAARTVAEETRQAAEAQRQAALEAQFGEILGEDGIAAYQEFAELSETDSVAAARKFAELLQSAQSRQGAASEGTPPAPPEGNVPAQTPPFPNGGVDGNAPLNPQAGEDLAALTASLDARYAEVVTKNQDPVTRNRVTMKERASGFIAFLGSAYLQADKK